MTSNILYNLVKNSTPKDSLLFNVYSFCSQFLSLPPNSLYFSVHFNYLISLYNVVS